MTVDQPGQALDTSFDDETPAVGHGSLLACVTFGRLEPRESSWLAEEEPPEIPPPDVPDAVSQPRDPFEMPEMPVSGLGPDLAAAPQPRHGVYLGAFLLVVGAGVIWLTLGLKILAW